MRHIINGQSVNLRQMTDRELTQAISNHEKRMALIDDELSSLKGELIRRQPIVVPALF